MSLLVAPSELAKEFSEPWVGISVTDSKKKTVTAELRRTWGNLFEALDEAEVPFMWGFYPDHLSIRVPAVHEALVMKLVEGKKDLKFESRYDWKEYLPVIINAYLGSLMARTLLEAGFTEAPAVHMTEISHFFLNALGMSYRYEQTAAVITAARMSNEWE